jgi:hypothetical protein
MLTLMEAREAMQAASGDGSERRRGLRIQSARPIKVFEPGAARYFGGQTQDISSTGLRLEVAASMPLREGKIVSVHVGLNEKGQTLANRRNMIPARVVWVDRSGGNSNRTVSIGIEFLASIAAQQDAA